MARDRGAYLDQSQSLNLYMAGTHCSFREYDMLSLSSMEEVQSTVGTHKHRHPLFSFFAPTRSNMQRFPVKSLVHKVLGGGGVYAYIRYLIVWYFLPPSPPPKKKTVLHAEPNTSRMTSMHFYAWKAGLKTGMYYLRTKPKAAAIQFTVDQASVLHGFPFLPHKKNCMPEINPFACFTPKSGINLSCIVEWLWNN